MMAEWGYEGWYLKKTREAMGPEGKVDGCAMFYKRNRFIMKEQYPIELNEVANKFVTNVMNEYDINYSSPTMAERAVRTAVECSLHPCLTGYTTGSTDIPVNCWEDASAADTRQRRSNCSPGGGSIKPRSL